MDSIEIGRAARLIGDAMGASSAREVINQHLRSGLIRSTCTRFSAASDWNIGPYPAEAENFELPASFWAPDWSAEGERIEDRSNGRSFNRLTLNAGWADGTFVMTILSGSRSTPFMTVRRAEGVRFRAEDFTALAQPLGIIDRPATPTSLRAPAQSECDQWLIDAFLSDPERTRTKADFQRDALAKISGLSGRAFNRSWANHAPAAGRDKPGPKRNS